MPPIRLDPDVAATVQQGTRAHYQRQGQAFALWLQRHCLRPESACEWDDLLVEWKNMESIDKSAFTGAVASVEYFFSSFRGNLPWSHHVLKGMNITHITRHTVPMLFRYACYYASHLAAMGLARLGAGMVVQQAKGLRPSEMLGLRAIDVLLPEEAMYDKAYNTVLNLGAKVGTKAKRQQAVIIQGNHVATEVLRRVKSLCRDPHERLFPYTLARYNTLIKRVSKKCGLEDVGWTAHSPRAGFASEARAQGRPFTDIREDGRWVADSSLRVYIDLVASAQLETDMKSRHTQASAAFTQEHILDYLSPSVLARSG